jgi:threonine dehydratase
LLVSSDVNDAAARLGTAVIRTPVRTSRQLDRRIGYRVFLKAENEQRGGAFKIRGALNAMLALSPAQLQAGVITASSGNHGLAVAMAAKTLHTTALVVIPHDCPVPKCSAIKQNNARIIGYDPICGDRDAIVALEARREGRTVVPSSDHPDVIAGAGTVALELIQDIGAIDVLVVPVGGGGLAAGCATALSYPGGRTRIIAVEPRTGDDTLRSLASGRRVRIPPPQTIADGLRHRIPGELTFTINRRLLDRVVLVSDAEIVAAMKFLREYVGVLAEPSGACALAAVLAGRVPEPPAARAAVVISGGNITESDAHRLMRNVRS